jgi:hypothetical protein
MGVCPGLRGSRKPASSEDAAADWRCIAQVRYQNSTAVRRVVLVGTNRGSSRRGVRQSKLTRAEIRKRMEGPQRQRSTAPAPPC